MSQFRQNAVLTPEERGEKINRRAEAGLNYLLALVIGILLAAALVKWWSA